MLIILDRDGVINEDSADFIKSIAQWRAIPGSLAAIAALNRAGHRVVVATNQSGVARGYFSLAALLDIHRHMQTELAKVSGYLDGVYFCPHRSDDCPCRKPNAGMLRQIARDFSVDLAQAGCLVGDSLRDIQAAQVLHCASVLVKSGKGRQTLAQNSPLTDTPVYENLLEFSTHLTATRRR